MTGFAGERRVIGTARARPRPAGSLAMGWAAGTVVAALILVGGNAAAGLASPSPWPSSRPGSWQAGSSALPRRSMPSCWRGGRGRGRCGAAAHPKRRRAVRSPACIGLSVIAVLFHQLARRDPRGVTAAVSITLSAIVLGAAPALLLPLRELPAGRSAAFVALVASGAALLAARLPAASGSGAEAGGAGGRRRGGPVVRSREGRPQPRPRRRDGSLLRRHGAARRSPAGAHRRYREPLAGAFASDAVERRRRGDPAAGPRVPCGISRGKGHRPRRGVAARDAQRTARRLRDRGDSC